MVALQCRSLMSEMTVAIELSVLPVNSIDSETMPMTEKTLEDLGQSGPKPILPYSSMFIFGQSNP